MSLLAQADPWVLVACVLALIAGGVVKGMTAVGLPLVAVPVMAALMPVPQALAIIALPSTATSLWQAIKGGRQGAAIGRIWPLLAGLVIGMTSSVRMLATVDVRRLNIVLGTLVAVYSLLLLRRVVVRVPRRHEWWAGALTGLAGGLIGGVSLFVGPIFAIYMAGLNLDRHVFIATLAFANLCAAGLFAVLIAGFGVAGGGDFILSAIATAIVFVGLVAGHHLRLKVNEEVFRRCLALVLLASGLNLLRKALL